MVIFNQLVHDNLPIISELMTTELLNTINPPERYLRICGKLENSYEVIAKPVIILRKPVTNYINTMRVLRPMKT